MTIAVETMRNPHTRRIRGSSIVIGMCVLILATVFVCAAFGNLIAPHSANAQDLVTGVSRPDGAHWFGTDPLGRDILSRVIVGARTAVIGPAVIALCSLLIGGTLGLLAGYRGNKTDWIIMRWVDLAYALPGLLVIIVVVGVLAGGYWIAVALLIILAAPYDTRVVRAATLEQRPLPYVEAARTLGLSERRIIFRHILPNVTPIIVANSFLNFAFMLVNLASLSFLGLGIGPGTPDWGRMLSENRTLITINAAAALAPAGLIVLTAASMNLIGDRVFELLSDRGRGQ